MSIKPIVLIAAVAVVGSLLALSVVASETPSGDPQLRESPIFGVTLPHGYRSWEVISVAHEAGNNNDIRVILGNDVAMKAFRNDTLPYPDGTVIARLAWKYESSAQNNAVFGREQSYVAGDPTNVQISVKDSQRYASTGGWGYGQFENGKPNPSETLMRTCFACHAKLPPNLDFVFTHYAN